MTHFFQGRCRDIYCPEDRYLSNGKCLIWDNQLSHDCYFYMFFIRLTPVSDMIITQDILQQPRFQNKIQYFVTRFVPETSVESLALYKKSTENRMKTVEYLVLLMLIDIRLFSLDVFSYLYTGIHGFKLDVMPSLQLQAEIVLYTLHSRNAMYLDSEIDFNSLIAYQLGTFEIVDFKGTISSEIASIECFTLFYKLLICPFLEISIKELFFRLEHDILRIETPRSTFLFGKLDYRIENDTISLCVEDYEAVFNALDNYSEEDGSKCNMKQITQCSILTCLSTFIYFSK